MIKKIEILSGENGTLASNSNVDVKVEMDNGDIFIPTFFAIENVNTLMKRWQETGEYDNGSHFWAKDAIIVNSLDEHNIVKIINYLVEERAIYNFQNYKQV